MTTFTQKQICKIASLKPRQVGFITERGGIMPKIRSDSRGVPNIYGGFNLFQYLNAAEMYRFQMPIGHIATAMQYLNALRMKRQTGNYMILPARKSFFPKIKPGTFFSIRPADKSPAKKPALNISYAEDTDPGELYEELCKRKDQRSLFIIDLYKVQAATLACL